MRLRIAWIITSLCLPLPLLLLALDPPVAAHPARRGPDTVLITEVAWAGTIASASDEWLELHNVTSDTLDLTGWTLSDGNDIAVQLTGVLAPESFYLLERTDDQTVSDVTADQIYVGALSNTGEILVLFDALGQVVDSVPGGAGWPGGMGSPAFRSMERAAATGSAGWVTHDGASSNGTDAAGNPIAGTPGQPNSAWALPWVADLAITKRGPASAAIGEQLGYQLRIANIGPVTGTAIRITDTLPASLEYVADDSELEMDRPDAATLVWYMPALAPGEERGFVLTATLVSAAGPTVTNTVIAWSPHGDADASNNLATAVTPIGAVAEERVLLEAVLYDGTVTGDLDEAVSLINVGTGTVDISGWSISDRLTAGTSAVLPAGTSLAPGQHLWLARDGLAFSRVFGHAPDLQSIDGVPGVPLLLGGWPGFSNSGDEVVLRDAGSLVRDVLVYEGGEMVQQGWQGPSVEPYKVGTSSGSNGQILYRKRDQETGLPVADTNSAVDWAQDLTDPINGRKVRYAGWDLDQFFFTGRITETARITVAVAPDNALEALLDHIASARESILIETLTFENLNIADGLRAALDRGVAVTVLLEGGPTGGIPDQERAICRQLELAGGACWFMISDADETILDRYSYLHAKFILVDGARVAIGSENLSLNSLPADDKADGTTGRRGVYLITDAPGVVAHVGRLFAADLQPRNETEPTGHIDLRRWNASDPVYGLPSPGYVPVEASGGISYSVRYAEPAVFEDVFAFEIVQSPENSLRDRDSLLGLIGRAGAGDTVLSQQLDEPPAWGVNVDGTLNPNLRLEALLAAARRGATVRLLLDSLMDDTASSTSNRQTCSEVRALALSENLDIQCAQANPTGLGIHNKMVLVRVAGEGYAHVGSINGSEQSSKGNRELALQVRSNALHAYLATLFWQDWPHRLFLPTALNGYDGAANHLLITEVLPDPTGPDGPEFVEIGNPTNREIDLGHFALSDATTPEDFEDVRRFPPGTRLAPGQMLVVAFEAAAFRSAFGRSPDFEIIDSDPLIPELLDDPAWGDPEALLQLGNGGDEIALRDSADAIVDLVVYGAGIFPGVTACPLPANGHALARAPWWRHNDHCPGSFAERFPPTPGSP